MSQEEVIIRFPKGLVGFPEAKEFRLYEPSDGYPYKFMQSVTSPEVSFTCIDAAAVKADYEVHLGDGDAETLALEAPLDALVLLMVVVPEDPTQMTANLAAPMVINTRTKVGVQVVLDSTQFPLKYPVFPSKYELRIAFPAGLIGFAQHHSFRLFEPVGGYPLKFLQSVDDPDVSFSCIDVAAIKPDYKVALGEEDAAALALEFPSDALVLAMLVIPADPRKMTANLAGPILINATTRVGRQIALNTEEFPLKFPIFPES